MSLFCVPLTLFGFCESPPVKDSNVFNWSPQDKNERRRKNERSTVEEKSVPQFRRQTTKSHIISPQLCCPLLYNEWYCSDKCNPLGEYSASVFFTLVMIFIVLYDKIDRTFGAVLKVLQVHISIEHQLIPMNIRLSVSNSFFIEVNSKWPKMILKKDL